MLKLNFWDAVTYGNQKPTFSERVLEKVEGYLYLGCLGCRRVEVVEPGKVVLCKQSPSSWLKTTLKILTFALILPLLVALVTKAVLRWTRSFVLVDKVDPKQPTQKRALPQLHLEGTHAEKAVSTPKKKKTVVQAPHSASFTRPNPFITPVRREDPQSLSPKKGMDSPVVREEGSSMREGETELEEVEQPGLYDPKRNLAITELGEGIDIEGAFQKIREIFTKDSFFGKNDQEIQWVSSQKDLKTFILSQFPDLIFKVANPYTSVERDGQILNANTLTDEHFFHMAYAYHLIKKKEWDRLVVPHAVKFEVGSYVVVAQERLNFNPSASAQEENFRDHCSKMGKALQQLACFIAETGWSDLAWNKIPLLNGEPNYQIGLIDLQEFEGVEKGFCGLIGCLFSPNHVENASKLALRQGVPQHVIEPTKQQRLKEIEEEMKLLSFHQQKGILENPDQSIYVEMEKLGLDLTATDRIAEKEGGQIKPFILRAVALDIIASINKKIKNASPSESVKQRRTVLIESSEGKWSDYENLGSPSKGFWLPTVLHLLVEKGHLYSCTSIDQGYLLQA